MSEKNNNHADVDIAKFIATLFDHRWLILAVTSLFCVLSITYVLFATPIYKADALVQVEQSVGSSILNDISAVLPNNQPASTAEIELIKSRMVLGKTVDDLNLQNDIAVNYFPIIGKGWARVNKDLEPEISIVKFSVPEQLKDEKFILTVEDNDAYTLSYNGDIVIRGRKGEEINEQDIILKVADFKAKVGDSFTIKQHRKIDVINDLLDNLTIADKGKDTGIISLSLLGESSEEIKNILNSITNNYLLQNIERKSAEAAKSLDFLKDQLPKIRSELNLAEDQLNQYRQKNDSVDLSLEAKSVLDSVVAVDTQLNELTFKEAEISKLYTKEHPAYRALLEKRKTLEDERSKLNKKVSGMPKTQQEILRLTRDVQSGQEVYIQLLNKQQELSINKASTVGNVRVIDSAVVQTKPVKPQKTIIIIVSALFGIMSSVFFVLVRKVLNRGIESSEQLEEIGINVYANIPLSEWQMKKDRELFLKNRHNKKKNTRSDELLAIGNPADLAIEAIRSLRTSLHFAMLESKNNILMISGASPSIGKTFVSMNLAAVIAQSGSKVLIIDADMRKGYSHELLGLKSDNGLSNVLSYAIPFEASIVQTGIPGLDFVPKGITPPNPSELLMSKSFSEFISWCQSKYDIVILDTPPILAVTDAAVIGQHAGTALLVARFGTTSVKEVEISIRRFEQNNLEIKGVIVNAVEKSASSNYSYGYYQYSYESEKKS
ncbi:Tyrosine-protein kinase wzc [Serratia fonticola]|uniref:tyrosine-protein kinase Wzc n=1 Tax=Serratia fonticola TaxID=47917 RepID=UPI00217A30E1|nr:tyrosine-protein kinase Wzc [Serratia fonticola]CAI1767169.1 Tyrosine-protein kinase wzc [Serratia fonticola]